MTAMLTPAAATSPAAAERLARAREVLAGAEARLGVVRDFAFVGPTPVGPAPVGAEPGAEAIPGTFPAGRVLPLDDDVAALLPGGVLRRGTVVSVEGSTSLVLAILARASREGSWAAIVGLPHVGVVSAARRGIDLSRLALIPHPGPEAATVAAACVDGMDIVVLGSRLAMSDADRRRLVARARERGVVILSVGPHPATHVALRVLRSEWSGLGAGEGRLKERTLTVARSGRHMGGVDEATITLDSDPARSTGLNYPGREAQARRALRLA
jgi:hypothetical protein